MIQLIEPYTEENIRALKMGTWSTSPRGVHRTGRRHKYLHEAEPAREPGEPDDLPLRPVVIKEKGKWAVKGSGPHDLHPRRAVPGHLIERYKLRAVIGKGGMGPKTLEACARFGCIYLHAVAAPPRCCECVTEVLGVYLEQFGSPEAIWAFRVKEFPPWSPWTPRNSLHAAVLEQSKERLKQLV